MPQATNMKQTTDRVDKTCDVMVHLQRARHGAACVGHRQDHARQGDSTAACRYPVRALRQCPRTFAQSCGGAPSTAQTRSLRCSRTVPPHLHRTPSR